MPRRLFRTRSQILRDEEIKAQKKQDREDEEAIANYLKEARHLLPNQGDNIYNKSDAINEKTSGEVDKYFTGNRQVTDDVEKRLAVGLLQHEALFDTIIEAPYVRNVGLRWEFDAATRRTAVKSNKSNNNRGNSDHGASFRSCYLCERLSLAMTCAQTP